MSDLNYIDEPCDELINGQWVAMSPHAFMNHSTIAENIVDIFKRFLKGKQCLAFAERNVYFDEENLFIPDAMILCDRNKISYRGIEGAPDLIVEVLSRGSFKKDRNEKMNIYEKYGVKEYWIVSPEEKIIEVYILSEAKFVLDNVYTIYNKDELSIMKEEEKRQIIKEFSISFIPDLKIQLAEVFEDLI